MFWNAFRSALKELILSKIARIWVVFRWSMLKPDVLLMDPRASLTAALFEISLVILADALPNRPTVLMKLFQLEAIVEVVVLKRF